MKMIFTFSFLLAFKCVIGQSDSLLKFDFAKMPSDYVDVLKKSLNNAEDRLNNVSNKYVDLLAMQEEQIIIKLRKVDSNAATQLIEKSRETYKQVKEKINEKYSGVRKLSSSYIPKLDSLRTSLEFLKLGELSKLNEGIEIKKINDVLHQIDDLQTKLDNAESIKNSIMQKQKVISDMLSKYGMFEEIKKFNKSYNYYLAEINEFKEIYNKPDKIILKSLDLLQKNPAFRSFFSKNSTLAQLFRLPDNSSSIPLIGVNGLQTRNSIQNLIQQRFGSAFNTGQLVQPNLGNPEAQLEKIKDKLKELGKSNTSDLDMPNYVPVIPKSKSLLSQLEFGANIQNVRSNGIFPSTSDIGLSIAYKISSKNYIGVGLAYKLGWGKDIQHIKISHQGIGFRSFVDLKFKGKIYITGGAELNYFHEITNYDMLKDFTAWKKSALVGITRKFKFSSKVNGNVQLLYDMLHNYQLPKTQPILFRFGYSL